MKGIQLPLSGDIADELCIRLRLVREHIATIKAIVSRRFASNLGDNDVIAMLDELDNVAHGG